MRGLKERFMTDLLGGLLEPIRQVVLADRDTLLEIRHNEIAIYFKGNQLLKLLQLADGYQAMIDPELTSGISSIPTRIRLANDVKSIIEILPRVKAAVINLHASGNEIEYEQMMIRTNNRESRLDTEYLLVDRQISIPGVSGRIDLTGLYLPRGSWHKSKTAALALIEVKFGLNPDISTIHEQLQKYYDTLSANLPEIVQTTEALLQQKVKLGLINHSKERLRAYEKLTVKKDISNVRFVIALVDYAPKSKLLNETKLDKLSFRNQIDIFHLGFGLWQSNARPRTLYHFFCEGTDLFSTSALDDKFNEAVELCLERKYATRSLLERVLSLDYGRAAKIFDQMEAYRIIGPFIAEKGHALLISEQGWDTLKRSLTKKNQF